jgi:FHIPEP family protein
MAQPADPILPVLLELGGHLQALAGAAEASRAADRLASRLRILLRQLGLPGEPKAELRSGGSARALRIWVHGRLLPFAPELMRQLWWSGATAELQGLAGTETAGPSPFPDGWLQAYVQAFQERGQNPPVLDFVAGLAYEAIRERPACLVGPAQAQIYAAQGAEAASEVPQSTDRLLAVLRALLDLGVAVVNRGVVLSTVVAGEERNRPAEDDLEAAFARLRARRIEVHAHPDHLRALLPGYDAAAALPVLSKPIPEDRQEPFRLLRDVLFYELGLHLPEIFWVPSQRLPPGSFAVKINDRIGFPVRGLRPEELLVDAVPEKLALHGVTSLRGTINPMTGAAAAVAPEAAKQALADGGFFALNALELIVRTLAAEIRRAAHRLFSRGDAELYLALLEPSFPDLVHMVLDRVSMGDVARVLRGLLREGVAIRDLRSILERLLQFDTIPVDSRRVRVLDDRLPTTVQLPASHRYEAYGEFVRQGMKSYLTRKAGGSAGTLPVFDLHLDLERLAAGNGRRSKASGEEEEEKVRDALWAAIGKLPADETRPAVLTTWEARAAIQRCLAPEFPGLVVLSQEELQPSVEVRSVPVFPIASPPSATAARRRWSIAGAERRKRG